MGESPPTCSVAASKVGGSLTYSRGYLVVLLFLKQYQRPLWCAILVVYILVARLKAEQKHSCSCANIYTASPLGKLKPATE